MEEARDNRQTSDAAEDPVVLEKGIDLSKYQSNVNWSEVKKSGVKHVCIKMTEGGTYVDPLFEDHWNKAEKEGIKVNAYHYFRALSTSPQLQLENIKNATKKVSFKPAENFLAIDVEEKGNEKATPTQMGTALNSLLDSIRNDSALKNTKLVIYTSPGYWDQKVLWEKFDFAFYPLWVAHYFVDKPRLPKPWEKAKKTWTWWQYTDEGIVKGIKGNVDLDWVRV